MIYLSDAEIPKIGGTDNLNEFVETGRYASLWTLNDGGKTGHHSLPSGMETGANYILEVIDTPRICVQFLYGGLGIVYMRVLDYWNGTRIDYNHRAWGLS